MIRLSTGNQWRSFNTGVMCSHVLDNVTNQAAAFWMRSNLLNSDFGSPYKMLLFESSICVHVLIFGGSFSGGQSKYLYLHIINFEEAQCFHFDTEISELSQQKFETFHASNLNSPSVYYIIQIFKDDLT